MTSPTRRRLHAPATVQPGTVVPGRTPVAEKQAASRAAKGKKTIDNKAAKKQ